MDTEEENDGSAARCCVFTALRADTRAASPVGALMIPGPECSCTELSVAVARAQKRAFADASSWKRGAPESLCGSNEPRDRLTSRERDESSLDTYPV